LSSTSSLIGSTLFWIGFGLVCWNFPRVLMRRETSILNKQPPYQVVGAGTSSGYHDTVIVDFSLNHPLVDPPTIDDLLLRSTSVYFPFIFLVLHAWYAQLSTTTASSLSTGGTDNIVLNTSIMNHTSSTVQRVHRVATVISSFSAALGLSEGFTVMIKLWVQRRRPNFYELCGFDLTSKHCTSTLKRIREANFSFPSGHSSLIACGMTFLVWYLHGASGVKISTTHRTTLSSRIFSLIITSFPLGWALLVAASRLVDHWHHPSDVIAGLGLGFVTSTIAFHHWYPPIWSLNAGIPLSLLSPREDRYNSMVPSTTTTGSEVPTISIPTTTKRRQVQNQGFGKNNNNNNNSSSASFEIMTSTDMA